MAEGASIPRPEDITGLILAGGQGLRMGGVDKGLVPLRGQPMVAHVHARFAPQASRVWISANRHAGCYAPWGERVLADPAAWAGAGPLAGVAGALAQLTTPWLATVACDMPRVPADLVAQLAAALRDGARAAVAEADGRLQPVCMLVAAELAAPLADYLAGGGRRVGQWLALAGAVRVPFAQASAFVNVNTPEELGSLSEDQASQPDAG